MSHAGQIFCAFTVWPRQRKKARRGRARKRERRESKKEREREERRSRERDRERARQKTSGKAEYTVSAVSAVLVFTLVLCTRETLEPA